MKTPTVGDRVCRAENVDRQGLVLRVKPMVRPIGGATHKVRVLWDTGAESTVEVRSVRVVPPSPSSVEVQLSAELARLRSALKPLADVARRLVEAREAVEASSWGGEDLLDDAAAALKALEES